MRITDTADLWWKNAVVYCLDVETFMDWNDDGCGDFVGVAQRIDHLADLGVTCLWLMPFYPSAERDDGYDITDFYGVDPRLGTHGDLVEVIRTAKDRGMGGIADLVVNHTSRKHPWFRSAEASKDSPFRDFYVWRSDPPPDTSKDVVFPDQESGIWTRSEKTGEWYLHRFYKEQPDLNVTDPRVRDELAKVMGFWLQLGLDGFRVDAVPFLLETSGVDAAEAAAFPDPHAYLRALRSLVGRRAEAAILLGEVNLPYEQQLEFFGGPDGDELTMQFDFITMQRLYLSLARGEAGAVVEALTARPPMSPDSQWATFVRNHDELTLDKLTDDEREEVFAAFGPEERMQVYGRGLRRRLPPLPGGDPRGAPPPAAADAGRRPAPGADGVQPAGLPARHPGALLRRGDRHGGGPRRRGPARRPDADAVDVGPQRRLLHRRPRPAARPGRRRRVRPALRQRRRPAPRPRLAA